MLPSPIVIGCGKRELALASPVLCAAGTLGYEPSAYDWEGLPLLGAYVTPPLTHRAQAGAERPSLARTTAGYVLHTGRRNPGLPRAIRRYGQAWEALGLPVIAALYATSPVEFRAMGRRLADVPWIQAVEMHVPHDANWRTVAQCVGELAAATPFPTLLRVPSTGAVECALAAAEAGADGFVVAGPWYGRVRNDCGRWIVGPLHSPALLPAYAELVHAVSRQVSQPIIGRGGVASAADALCLLSAGAHAVQVGSALYATPGLLRNVYEGLETEFARNKGQSWDAFLAGLRSAG